MGAQISTNLSSGCSSNIKSKADLVRYIKNANKSTLMVINFTTTWCQPCIEAEPPMRKLTEKFPHVKFARVDIDLLQDVVTEFDLKTMPTFLLLCKKVDDGPDKGNGAPEVGGGNGSGNRISSANNVKEGNSAVPSATQGKRTTSITEGNNVVSSASEGKSATSNSGAAGATGGKSGTGVERANSPAVSGLKGESTTANAKKNGDGVTAVKEGNSVPSPKRRAVNYGGEKVFEIDRMEGPLEVHELRKKIRVNSEKEIIPDIFKSTDEFYRYLGKSKPTQLMVINVTTEWCGPCKKADEPFNKLSKVYEDVKFAKVDVDALMKIAEDLDVKMMPTFLLVKVKKLEKEYVTKDGVQGDHKEKKEAPEKELVKKDGVQGDHKVKKIPPENKRYEMEELGRLVGWNDKREGELRKMIRELTGTLYTT